MMSADVTENEEAAHGFAVFRLYRHSSTTIAEDDTICLILFISISNPNHRSVNDEFPK
jgi:hypothetical protein